MLKHLHCRCVRGQKNWFNMPSEIAGTGEKDSDAQKRLPMFLRPLARVAAAPHAVIRGMCIALTVWWLEQACRYMGWTNTGMQ